MEDKKVCKCMHHKLLPWGLVLIGLSFLLMQLNILSAYYVGIIWPILLIAIGVEKLMKCNCC